MMAVMRASLAAASMASICAGSFGPGPQHRAVELGRRRKHVVRGGAALHAAELVGGELLLLDGDAHALRELLHRLDERQALQQHQELEGISTGLASEAVEDVLVWDDVEGGGLLLMERTQPLVGLAEAIERDMLLDDSDDVDAVADLIDGLARNAPHGRSSRPRWQLAAHPGRRARRRRVRRGPRGCAACPPGHHSRGRGGGCDASATRRARRPGCRRLPPRPR